MLQRPGLFHHEIADGERERTLRFWRDLYAEFPREAYGSINKGGRTLTYINARAIMTRLDNVCGPSGWTIEYKPTQGGYMARLGIYCPAPDGTWGWAFKEDGAGFEEMGSTDKKTGEFERDVDNDEKSAYTNAFRRVAQNAWGIERELYPNCGQRWFLNPDLDRAEPQQKPTPAPKQEPPPKKEQPATTKAPKPAPSQATKQDRSIYEDLRIPTRASQFFAWVKRVEGHYQTHLVKIAESRCGDNGWTTTFRELEGNQIEELVGVVIGTVRTLANYGGEFGSESAPEPQGATDIGTLKATVIGLAKAIARASNGGKDPDDDQVMKAIRKVASEARDRQGHQGEILESLKSCKDSTWVQNMVVEAQRVLKEQPVGSNNEPPF